MQFTIGKTAVTLEINDTKDYVGIANALLADEAVAAEIKAHAASFYFRAWENDGDIDQKAIDKVVSLALESGVDAAVDYMVENNWDRNPTEYFRSCDGHASTEKLLSDFLAKFAAAAGFDADTKEAFREAIVEVVSEAVEEALPETDKSTPAEAFASGHTARVAFVQGYGNRGYIDDIASSHADNTCQTDTVHPDRNLMLQFKLLNISPVEFIEYYAAKHGQDLRFPDIGENVSDYHRRQFLENAAAWRYACDVFAGADVSDAALPDWLSYGNRAAEMAEVIRSCKDVDRPPAVSLETLETILDNATYGGVATWYGRVNVREIMRGEFESSFIADGGQIGVHDFINGSGYLDSVENDVLIDMRDGKLVGDGRFKYNPEEVYGFTHRALNCNTRGAKVSDWVRYTEDTWRNTATDDGLYAEIALTGGVADSDRKVFLVTTKDVQNSVSGPLDNYEICGSLDDAMTEAMDRLADYAPASSSSPAPRM